MQDTLSKDQESTIITALKKGLDNGGYEVRFSQSVSFRVVGVQDGELFLAMTCRAFKKDKL